WADPATGRANRVRWRVYVFFWPVDEDRTAITSFTYVQSRYPVGPAGGARLFRWLARRKVDAEIRADPRGLEDLARPERSLQGLKLSRFDKPLGLNRERLERVYRGRPGTGPSVVGAPVA